MTGTTQAGGAVVVDVTDLSHRYSDALVLNHVSLVIERGEVFGLLGHNGAGKTTMINILTTLLTPTSGSARVLGFDVVQQRADVAKKIGYLPADVRLYPHLTSRENVEFFASLSGVDDRSAATEDALDYLGCVDYADQRVGSLSTGMRQRVGIAQAIVHRPDVLFLDEPTNGLDPIGVRQLRDIIARLNSERGMTVVMNTHLLSEVSKVCSTIGILNHGELIHKDSIESTQARFPDETSLEDVYVRIGANADGGQR